MAKTLLLMAAISGLLAVTIGAFGAHGLKGRLSVELMTVFQTGVQYHFYHTMALLAIGILLLQNPQLTLLHWAGYCMLAGIIVFSGSLYMLALTGTRWLGAITPIGGVLFIVGWLCLAISVSRGLAKS